jgi:hypothetical protein
MDLPVGLRAAVDEYKLHTNFIKEFITSHGGRVQSPRDWDFAPYQIAHRLRDKGIPAHLEDSLLKAIASREMVGKHYEEKRDRENCAPSEIDLRHLSFIDKLRNIRRCWFPENSTTNGAHSSPSTESTHDEECLCKFGVFISVLKKEISIQHPYHDEPILWAEIGSLSEAKTELRRYLQRGWPVTVTIEDSLGMRTLTRKEYCGFAWNTVHQEYEDYERTGITLGGLKPTVDDEQLSLFDAFVDIRDTFESFRPEDVQRFPAESPESVEVLRDEHVWRQLNVTVPSERKFSAGRTDPRAARFQNDATRVSFSCVDSDIKNTLKLLQSRGDIVTISSMDRRRFRTLDRDENVDDLFDIDGDFVVKPSQGDGFEWKKFPAPEQI